MTKNVLVTISGLHYNNTVVVMHQDGEAEAIEITTPASYYMKNGKHYVVYDEVVEGVADTIKNRITIIPECSLEIKKSGAMNSRMLFEKDKINVQPYETPYGSLLLGTYTRSMDIREEERKIEVCVRYALDINGEKAAECDIKILIEANE